MWGRNGEGQCGRPRCSRRVEAGKVIVGEGEGGEPVVDVAVGRYHSVALTASGRVYTWGALEEFFLGPESQFQDSDDEEGGKSTTEQVSEGLDEAAGDGEEKQGNVELQKEQLDAKELR